MTVTLAVDPGVHQCGYARGDGARLTAAGMHETAGRPLRWDHGTAVSEIPQVYQGRKVRTSDLVDLAAAAGRVCALHSVRYYRPGSWKGQVPKKIHHARMWEKLDENETAILKALDVPKGLRHNVYDAVCLLLRAYGRM